MLPLVVHQNKTEERCEDVRTRSGRARVPLSAAASYCGRRCCAYCVSAARALLLLLPRSKAAAAAASCSTHTRTTRHVAKHVHVLYNILFMR